MDHGQWRVSSSWQRPNLRAMLVRPTRSTDYLQPLR
jgi:hypothetical protein